MPQLAALGVQPPQIDALGGFARGAQMALGAQQAQQELAMAPERHRSAMQSAEVNRQGAKQAQAVQAMGIIGSVALGAMGGDINGKPDPKIYEQGLDYLQQQGIDVSQFRGKPELAPIVARSSLTALQQIQTAQNQQQLDLAMKKFEFDVQQAAKGPEPTAAIKEFEYGQENPDFRESQLELERAGADSIVFNEEKEYSKAVGKADAEARDKVYAGAETAQDALASLNIMQKAMADPGFYSGAGSETVLQAKRLGRAFGLDVEGIDSMEAFSSEAKKSVLASMGGSLGTGFSEGDRKYVDAQMPRLENSPEGNALLIEIQKRIQQRKVQIAKLADVYMDKNNGRFDQRGFNKYKREWVKSQGDMFADLPGFESETLPKVGRIGTEWNDLGGGVRIRRKE